MRRMSTDSLPSMSVTRHPLDVLSSEDENDDGNASGSGSASANGSRNHTPSPAPPGGASLALPPLMANGSGSLMLQSKTSETLDMATFFFLARFCAPSHQKNTPRAPRLRHVRRAS